MEDFLSKINQMRLKIDNIKYDIEAIKDSTNKINSDKESKLPWTAPKNNSNDIPRFGANNKQHAIQFEDLHPRNPQKSNRNTINLLDKTNNHRIKFDELNKYKSTDNLIKTNKNNNNNNNKQTKYDSTLEGDINYNFHYPVDNAQQQNKEYKTTESSAAQSKNTIDHKEIGVITPYTKLKSFVFKPDTNSKPDKHGKNKYYSNKTAQNISLYSNIKSPPHSVHSRYSIHKDYINYQGIVEELLESSREWLGSSVVTEANIVENYKKLLREKKLKDEFISKMSNLYSHCTGNEASNSNKNWIEIWRWVKETNLSKEASKPEKVGKMNPYQEYCEHLMRDYNWRDINELHFFIEKLLKKLNKNDNFLEGIKKIWLTENKQDENNINQSNNYYNWRDGND